MLYKICVQLKNKKPFGYRSNQRVVEKKKSFVSLQIGVIERHASVCAHPAILVLCNSGPIVETTVDPNLYIIPALRLIRRPNDMAFVTVKLSEGCTDMIPISGHNTLNQNGNIFACLDRIRIVFVIGRPDVPFVSGVDAPLRIRGGVLAEINRDQNNNTVTNNCNVGGLDGAIHRSGKQSKRGHENYRNDSRNGLHKTLLWLVVGHPSIILLTYKKLSIKRFLTKTPSSFVFN